jgi:hypothetical protein
MLLNSDLKMGGGGGGGSLNAEKQNLTFFYPHCIFYPWYIEYYYLSILIVFTSTCLRISSQIPVLLFRISKISNRVENFDVVISTEL